MLSSWTSRVAALAFTTVSACGVIALSPLLWSDPVVGTAIAEQPDGSTCTANGGVLFDAASPGNLNFAENDVIWAADTDGDGVRYEIACYCQVGTTCQTVVPGVFDDPVDLHPNDDDLSTFTDCDDDSPLAFGDDGTSGAGVELCDTLDNDCNGTIDDGILETAVWYVDDDQDGFGVTATAFLACASAYGPNTDRASRVAGDCDDADGAIYPGAPEDGSDSDCNDGLNRQLPELCNGIDDDDDGTVDEGWPTGNWYEDFDGDGFGVGAAVSFCLHGPIAGYADNNTDCDDLDPTAGGDGTGEVADNGIDDDCDAGGATVDGSSEVAYREDADGDFFFKASVLAIMRSDNPVAEAALADLGWYPEPDLVTGDCDDEKPLKNPAMTEIAWDGLDNDCDNQITSPDDGSATTEVCDGFDNDGDGFIDNNFPGDTVVDYFADLDNDGQGDPGRPIDCGATPPPFPAVAAGSTNDTDDCDDQDADVRFDAAIPETCGPTGLGDGRDNNCDGSADGGVVVASVTELIAAAETCDAIDNNCDQTVDEGLGLADFYQDRDADGNPGFPLVVDSFCSAVSPIPPHYLDDSTPPTDCDDTVNGSPEVAVAYYLDADIDNEGEFNGVSVMSCVAVAGRVTNSTDCNDGDDLIGVGLPEICDGVDNDCDALIDEVPGTNDTGNLVNFFTDEDVDTYGLEGSSAVFQACSPLVRANLAVPQTGYSENALDCVDDPAGQISADAAPTTITGFDIKPGATDVAYDDIDANCDNENDYDAENDDLASATEVNADFVNNAAYVSSRSNGDEPLPATDCDDTVSSSISGVLEYFPDSDGDGEGEQGSSMSVFSCDPVAGHVTNSTDCVDTDQFIGDTLPEICDSVDNDCDGLVDEDETSNVVVVGSVVDWYVDADDDSYGVLNGTSQFQACSPLEPGRVIPLHAGTFSTSADDCVDATEGQDSADIPSITINGNLINPGIQVANDDPYDDIDENCDQLNDYDADGDGFADLSNVGMDFADTDAYELSRSFFNDPMPATDCGDNDADVNPDVLDDTNVNGIDNDCDGLPGVDADNDGEASVASGGGDCIDDPNTDLGPSVLEAVDVLTTATEIWYDDIDQNCDGANDFDQDGDLYASLVQSAAYSGSDSETCAGQFSGCIGGTLSATDCDDNPQDNTGSCIDDVTCADLVNPGVTDDDVDNSVDNNCDNVPGIDGDGDLEASEASGGLDCDDVRDDINTNNTSDRTDGVDGLVDTNCDGIPGVDGDGDLEASELSGGLDCDDTTEDINTSISDDRADGPDGAVDNNCDGVPGVDADGDGQASQTTAGTDCDDDAGNDTNDCADTGSCAANTFLGANEVCADGIDQNCGGDGDVGVPEVCDGVDNDCQNGVDDSFVLASFYDDGDVDGFGAELGASIQACVDASIAGKVANNGDCDDTEPLTNPDAAEICGDGDDNDCDPATADSGGGGGGAELVCNGIDDNCDGTVDEGAPATATFYLDVDSDGYGVNLTNTNVSACKFSTVPGYSSVAGDCDDANPDRSPGVVEICANLIDDDCNSGTNDAAAFEVCDGFDNNCTNGIDDGLPRATFYVDADDDGFGDLNPNAPGTYLVYKEASDNSGSPKYCVDVEFPNATLVIGDCNSSDPAVNPDAREVCGDGIDNNCDGLGDGPGALPGLDTCNGFDDDCDGSIDEDAVRVLWYSDLDRDGFGQFNQGVGVLACAEADPSSIGGVSRSKNTLDCDDTNPAINPDAFEVIEMANGVPAAVQIDNNCDVSRGTAAPDVCDGVDNDGDGEIDEDGGFEINSLSDLQDNRLPYYPDVDGDGFGDISEDPIYACDGVSIEGYAVYEAGVRDADCGVLDARVYPGAVEVCDDFESDNFTHLDTNCNGVTGQTNVNGVFDVEECDGVDNNCDGSIDEVSLLVPFYNDLDGDGFGAGVTIGQFCIDAVVEGASTVATDCQPRVASVYPGQTEDCNDGFDNNCDSGSGTADDLDGGAEVCNGLDDDCNGVTDDTIAGTATDDYYIDVDGDGFGAPALVPLAACPDTNGEVLGYSLLGTDCDDSDPAVNTSADEVCNSRDDNCDGVIDTDTPNDHPSKLWYPDSDRDGYGSSQQVDEIVECNRLNYQIGPSPALTRDSRDCVDASGTSRTGYEIFVNGTDATGGFITERPGARDKTITAQNINPGETEVFYDEIDQDCFESSLQRAGSLVDGDQDGDRQVCDGSVVYPVPSCPIYFAGSDCVDAEDQVSITGYENNGDAIFGVITAYDILVVSGESNPRGITDISYDGVNQTCRGDTINGVDVVFDDFDQDGDGFSDSDAVQEAVGGGYSYDILRPPATDCNDDALTGAGISPAAFEICNNDVDEDCSGALDDFGNVLNSDAAFTQSFTFYPDFDGDGFGDENAAAYACDQPNAEGKLDVNLDFISTGRDCNDTVGEVGTTGVRGDEIYPEADETYYNGIVQDCDVRNDFDADGDGYASIAEVAAFYGGDVSAYNAAVAIEGWDPLPATDCLDNGDEVLAAVAPGNADPDDPDVTARESNPGRQFEDDGVTELPGGEACDLIDNDCDGQIDENSQLSFTDYFIDRDEDGFGALDASGVSEVINGCRNPSVQGATQFSETNNDCEDDAVTVSAREGVATLDASLINPGITDAVYDAIIADCAFDRNDFDKDGDGYASDSAIASAFGVDGDSTGVSTYFDLYRDSGTFTGADLPVGDCNDADATINPDYIGDGTNPFNGDLASDGIDSDCDGVPGDDRDGDGVPSVESGGFDCVDDPTVVLGSNDGVIDLTVAADQIFGRNTTVGFVKSAAVERYYDDVDQNCDDKNDFDRDGDLSASIDKIDEYRANRPTWSYLGDDTRPTSVSYQLQALQQEDCEDGEVDISGPTLEDGLYRTSPPNAMTSGSVQSAVRPLGILASNIRPGALDAAYDGIDQNCDGKDDFDVDEDGFASDTQVPAYNTASDLTNDPTNKFGNYLGGLPTSDCNDNEFDINPSVVDDITNGIDNNCDGTAGVDGDGDGFNIADDCDDDNPLVYPGAGERCEQGLQIDNDCDGNVNKVGVPIDTDGDGLVDLFVSEYVTSFVGDVAMTALGGTVGNLSSSRPFYIDGDEDGFADVTATEAIYLCRAGPAEAFYSTTKTDCNDNDGSINPGAEESCNNFDDNCNDSIDEPNTAGEPPLDTETYYIDNDQDGYGMEGGDTLQFCDGFITNAPLSERIECAHDGVPAINPNAIDNDLLQRYGIKFGGECYSVVSTDCYDDEVRIHPVYPGEPQLEQLDGWDNDCDGFIPVIELDLDNDGQLPLLPIASGPSVAGAVRPEGEWTSSDTFLNVAELNVLAGASSIADPADPDYGQPNLAVGLGFVDCHDVAAADKPQVRLGAESLTLICRDELDSGAPPSGLWEVSVGSLDDILFNGGFRLTEDIGIQTLPQGDCDDISANREKGRAERCDGVDNDCIDATQLDVHLDLNLNGLPDHMEEGSVTPGYVYEDEIDYDGDGELACISDARVNQTGRDVSLIGGEAILNDGGDCNNLCSLMTVEEPAVDCAGFAECGNLPPTTVDEDGDGYSTCGVYGDDDSASDETLFVLAYAFNTIVQSELEDEVWDVIPLLMPRERLASGEPAECDAAQFDALNGLLGVENVFNDGQGLADLLSVCVELDVCRDMDRNGLELPAFCPAAEELDRHRCVISQLTLSRDDDGGVFTLLSADNSDDEMRFGDLQTEYPGCLETNGDSWYPEQVVLRSLWTRARIRDSRRLVTEWECYRSTGDFGCGGVDDLADRKREDLVLRDYGFRRPGGFNANDDRWRAMTGAQLSSDSDNDLMFNRFSPLAHTDGLLLGCWGDEVLSGFEETTTGSIVGGDCADADALEAEPSLEGVLEAQNRGRYEGPDDLLAVFDGRAVDCDVCTDGIDNNCNGTIDCLEPACARCYVGQSSGGCGADACSVGGCSSSSTGGIQSTGAMSLLMLMLGLGWRRRREDEDEDLAA
ncbi:MAG: hypothetical protein ACJA00_000325 [Myxococcota bacterium]|jgi:hypothetical protein